ncbi:MAG: sigma factor-like helix-turn-helix DNA-binding protein, partial [Candidatus Binatia bacterium]
MGAKRLPMRRLREVLRLRYGCGLSLREIARGCSMGTGTVWQYLSRAEGAGVSWPLPEGLD